jgi:hypothetical protein
MHLRTIKRLRQEVSLNDPIGVDKEGNEIVLLDVLGTSADEVPDIVETQCEKENLYEVPQHLGRRERKVIELRYGLPYGRKRAQREIARVRSSSANTDILLSHFKSRFLSACPSIHSQLAIDTPVAVPVALHAWKLCIVENQVNRKFMQAQRIML